MHGFSEVPASRGESAYVVDVGPFYIASIVECLGSKALVADEMHRLTGKSYIVDLVSGTASQSRITRIADTWPRPGAPNFENIWWMDASAWH